MVLATEAKWDFAAQFDVHPSVDGVRGLTIEGGHHGEGSHSS